MLVSSFGPEEWVWERWEREMWAEGLLSSTEDDSRSEEEREGTPGGVLGHQKVEALGSRGSAREPRRGSLFALDSGSAEWGGVWEFLTSAQLLWMPLLSPYRPLSLGPAGC